MRNKSVPDCKQEEWLEQLMDQYGNRLMNLAFSYLKDWGRAQEVVQDVFVTCFQRAHQLEEIRSVEAWPPDSNKSKTKTAFGKLHSCRFSNRENQWIVTEGPFARRPIHWF